MVPKQVRHLSINYARLNNMHAAWCVRRLKPLQQLRPAEPLAAFRIVAALVAMVDLATLFAHRDLFFRSLLTESHVPRGLQWFFGNQFTGAAVPTMLLYASFAAWELALLSLACGLSCRTAASVHWLFSVLLFGRGFEARWWQTADMVLLCNAFFLMTLPVGRVWSVDARRKPSSQDPGVTQVFYAVFVLTLGCLYLDSALRKIRDSMWVNGWGVWAPGTIPNTLTRPIPWIPDDPVVWQLFGWATMAFELLFLGLYIWRQARVVLLVIGITLHLGIAILYPIPIFTWAMLSWYVPLLWWAYSERSESASKQAWPSIQPSRRTLMLWSAWVMILLLNTLDALRPVPGMPVVRRLMYPIAGVSQRGVFAGSMFSHYTYQLSFVADSCRDRTLHTYQASGFLASGNRDRVWELWWKKSQAPWTAKAETEAYLSQWVAYWAVQSGCGSDTIIRLYVRRFFFSPSAWQPGALQCNLAVPWAHLASLRLQSAGKWHLEWSPSSQSVHEAPTLQFGEFLHDRYLVVHREAEDCISTAR